MLLLVQVLDDDDEEDEMEAQEPLPTKKRAAKARQQMVLEDSDDDFAPSPKKEKTETGEAHYSWPIACSLYPNMTESCYKRKGSRRGLAPRGRTAKDPETSSLIRMAQQHHHESLHPVSFFSFYIFFWFTCARNPSPRALLLGCWEYSSDP